MTTRRWICASAGVRLATLGLACAMAEPSGAADFAVSTTADSGAGSLRQGVVDANASVDPTNRISFSPANLGTITVDTSLAGIAKDLTIDALGSTPSELLVRGPGPGLQLYAVNPGVVLTLIDAPFTAGDIVLGSGASVIFETSVDQLVDQAIRDGISATGSLEKRGAGELTLTGANTYSGGTTVSAGTLVVNSTSLPGNAVIASGALLAFDEPVGAATFADSLSGAGGVEKRGLGALTLSGTNTYNGTTSVLGGSLIGRVANIPGNVAVASGARFQLIADNGMDDTFGGALTGAGTFDKNGPDRLILQANNSIANIHILQGILAGNAAALSSGALIDAGATLEIIETSTAASTIAGGISGGGNVLSSGTGVVRLSGVNTFNRLDITNGRLVSAGSSSLPLLVGVSDPGLLTFNSASDILYGGVISGSGGIEKRSQAILDLTAASTFTGKTTVRTGELRVTGPLGSLASDVDVMANSLLSGSGSIGGLVTNFGTVEATPSRRLTVNDLTLEPGSRLSVTIDPALTADLLTVTNAATLLPGTLEIKIQPGAYGIGQQFTLVSAGALDGKPTFNQLPFFDFVLDEVGEDLVLTATPSNKTFSDFATNRNQQAVALALDLEEPTASPDLTSVIQSIKALSTGIPEAYDALGGEQGSQFATARLELADRLDRSLHGRLRRRGDALPLPAMPGSRTLPAVSAGGDSRDTSSSFWLEPFGVFGKIDGRQGAHDTDYTLAGVALGADFTPLSATPNIRLGGALAYGHTGLRYDSLVGSGDAHSYLGALYGGWSQGRLRAGLSARVGYSDMATRRRIRIGSGVGAQDRIARADFDGLDAGARFEAGAKLLQTDRYLVEPFVSVGYAHLERSGFREHGAGAVNLHVSREKLDSAPVGAGVRARAIFRIDSDLVILPEVHSEWNQQLADRDRRVDARFQDSLAGSSFTVRGTELHRSSGVTGVGWAIRTSDGVEARFGYEVGYGSDHVAHAIALQVGGSW